jgi:hypothetical protein
LTSVTIPRRVTRLNGAFWDCTGLREVYFEGNASDETVYCLPGTTGWGTTSGGLPTAPWLPQMQTINPSFGVQTNRFGFTIVWASDKVVVVEATTSLTNPIWSPVSTNTLTGGTSYFSDPQWATYPRLFYRIRSQ